MAPLKMDNNDIWSTERNVSHVLLMPKAFSCNLLCQHSIMSFYVFCYGQKENEKHEWNIWNFYLKGECNNYRRIWLTSNIRN